MIGNVNIAKAKLSWLGFGYDPQFSKSTHSLFRAGYKSNNDHQIYNEDFAVDEANENRFLGQKMSIDAHELGMLSNTNTMI